MQEFKRKYMVLEQQLSLFQTKKWVTKTIKNKTKEQKGGFLSMLLGTLGVNFLGNMLEVKGIARDGSRNKKGKGIVRAGYGKEWDF